MENPQLTSTQKKFKEKQLNIRKISFSPQNIEHFAPAKGTTSNNEEWLSKYTYFNFDQNDHAKRLENHN